MHSCISRRRGITVLEVLISVGILAIGLSSVVALVPAGRAQASRAVIMDRASMLAANALADAATFGLLRNESLTAVPATSAPVFIDVAPLAANVAAGATTLTQGWLKRQGVLASSTATVAAVRGVHTLLCQSRDDISFSSVVGDELPLNIYADGVRAFDGRMTCVYCMQPPAVVGGNGTLSVIVFYARDPELTTVQGTIANFEVSLVAGGLKGRSLREIVRPGGVVFANNRFHQITAASVSPDEKTGFVSLSTGAIDGANAGVAHFFVDSVGLAERPYSLETGGEYSR